MRLAPRVARLERHHGLHGPDRRDPETARLYAEARTNAEMRHATRQLAARMWQSAGRPERAAAVLGGRGSPADALVEAISALDTETRAQYARAVRRVMAEATRHSGSRGAAQPPLTA